MPIAARARPRRAIARVSAAVIVLVFAGAAGFLPFAGRFLVREDPLETADAIFVLAGGRVDRWLEGTDLFRERLAPRIVLSPGLILNAEMQLRAKGIRYPGEAEIARDAILQLGVPPDAVLILPGSLDNTAHEAQALHHLLQGTGWQRVIVVTSPYHTRRARFAFRREFRGTPVRILIRASRYDESQPARWWRRRADVRFVTSELQKLVLYGFGLGS